MIDDSVPWREELAHSAARLRSRLVQRRWQQRTFYLVERDLMVGFYAIRRLIESQKTSSRLASRRVAVRVCPISGREPGVFDRWSPWDHYDLASRNRSEIDVQTLLHEFIHSFVLRLSFDEDGEFRGVFVGSDRTKKRHLYEVSVRELIHLFSFVAREDVVFSRWGQYQPAIRLSQHDLVEVGAAFYGDETETWYDENVGFDPAELGRLSGLKREELAALPGLWAGRKNLRAMGRSFPATQPSVRP